MEYALDRPYSILLAIDQHSIATFRLPSQGEIEPLIANYLDNIGTPDKNKTAGQRLGEVLLGPVWKRPQKRLIVVGHGALEALPFDALVTPDGHYVAETYVVTSGQTATVLYEIRSRGDERPQKGLLGVAVCGTISRRIA